ncbi:hypothetical protein [Oleiagrimonas sp.]|jgi:hypothetical protein|uniref:hypothetical protein n=1 Tax=Oleiagrimonas sp. TaxID=2010330 RepID=UPI00263066A4|nr:hypothetical protein [Oleiagrimonas sp.]MDA3915268.1 hypothetical protein [Oleiagrimonas sp.]
MQVSTPASVATVTPTTSAPGQVPLVIGVTSHRNLDPYEVVRLHHAVRNVLTRLMQQFPKLPLTVLSALAEGGDRLVADEALACGAKLVAVLPLPPELYVEDFSDARSRLQFADLCQRASVLQLPLLPRNTRANISVAGTQRDAQYAEAGIFIASHCHILLALWDGRPSNLYGGTAQIVHYHLHGVLPGLVERRRSRRPLFDQGDESLVCHIACSRRLEDGTSEAPLPPLQPLQARWLSPSDNRPLETGLKDGFVRIFQRMVQFNNDARDYGHEIAQHAPHESGTNPENREHALLAELFNTSDWLAIHFQKRVQVGMRSIHILAALMGIAFVGYSDLPGDMIDQTPMLYLFIALFAAGVVLDRIARRREWHRKYIDYRALAEGLRVQQYWHRAGVAASESVAFAHDNFLQKQDIELGWIRNVMRAAGLYKLQFDGADTQALDKVIDEWIGTALGGGQLYYYTQRTDQRIRVHQAAQRLGRICLWSGIFIGLILMAFHRMIDSDATTSLVAMIGVLAIIAAARESYAWRRADKELIKQYRFMRNIFTGARAALDAEPDPQERREILGALGEAALAEHAEWALMHRERPLEHGKL